MRYVFGDYTLDTQLQELWHTGQPVPLRPKVFQVLAYLLEHHDRVVPKAELLEQFWPGQFIGDAALNSCLKELRQAVGDSGSAQQVVHTLRGRGYRFVAAVEIQPAPLADGPVPRQVAVEAAAREKEHAHSASAHCSTCRQPLDPVPPPRHAAPLPWHPAPSVPPPPAAAYTLAQEHKNVTVLCCALTDAPACAAALGAEGMHEVMQTLLAHAQHMVQRYAGTITHWGGDGFTALFGAPVAYEDHAWRAVLAASELQERLRQPMTLPGHDAALTLSVAIELHTGAVLVGRLAHAPQHLYTAAGPTTYLASRLQGLAAPGMPLISETTYRLVHDVVQARL